MSQLVILKLGKGDWQQGFPNVSAQLWEADSTSPTQFTGSLPAAPELPELYKRWQSLYIALHSRIHWQRIPSRAAIEIEDDQVTNISDTEFQAICHQLKSQLNRWIDSGSFGRIERRLRAKLVSTQEIRVIIETEDSQLRRFPWHLWSLFEDFPQAEVALSTPEFREVKPLPRIKRNRVRILAILGNSQGIEVKHDRQLLEHLPSAETIFLVEPQRSELNHWLWDEGGWDILFFAGHSASHTNGEIGEIAVNQTDSLTIAQLRNALRAAIERGLNLAIFNSCDGLGLAKAMSDLDIPQLIVMREPVPDRVAQAFLKYFLAAFSSGKSLYLSFREARERLQGIESEFPCASWLPIICQNPTKVHPTWKELTEAPSTKILPRSSIINLPKVIIVSVVALATILTIKQFGLLQMWELKAYDHLMQLRPKNEEPDPRLLVITVTAEDVRAQTDRRGSLSNNALSQLLERLDQYKPALIGLDIYRDLPIEAEYASLSNRLRQDDRLVAICSTGETDEDLGVPPPPDIPFEHLRKRVGFSDNIPDFDGTFRRQYLGQAAPEQSLCQTSLSVNFLLASRYLQEKDSTIQIKFNQTDVQVGDVVFKVLEDNTSGYRKANAGGYQILLNYRASDLVAQQLTLDEALKSEKLTSELVKDKIILIGTTDPNFGDLALTPYSRNTFEQMPGVIIQAHMVSQILSAVLDGRSLIWWLPEWGNILWVWVWSFTGGLIAWRARSWAAIGLIGGMAITVLYGSCYVLFLWGGWFPLVPSALALMAALTMLVIYAKTQMS